MNWLISTDPIIKVEMQDGTVEEFLDEDYDIEWSDYGATA